MSKKAFIIWGLALIHVYLLTWSVGLYLMLSKIIPGDLFSTRLSFLLGLMLVLGFGVLLSKRLKTTGHRTRVLALCAAFYVAAWIFTVTIFTVISMLPDAPDLLLVEAAHDKFTNHIRTWEENGGIGPVWSPTQKIELILFGHMPSHYLMTWPLFALLWFGSREPKNPKKSRIFSRNRQTKTETAESRYSDPIFINETWILRS